MKTHPSGSRARALTLGARLGLVTAVGALAATALARRAKKVKAVAPELRNVALWVPVPTTRFLLPALRWSAKISASSEPPVGATASVRHAPGPTGSPDVRIVLYQRAGRRKGGPALLWIHGGGFLLGVPEMDRAIFGRILDRLDVAIVAVDYRLAPEHPFPAPLDDCYAALRWMVDQAAALEIDAGRIAVAGASAGGGLAAALVQRVVDQGPVPLACQILVYPMLDNRTGVIDKRDGRGELSWTPADNRRGWEAYLGRKAGDQDHRTYAVPAPRAQGAGGPPPGGGGGGVDEQGGGAGVGVGGGDLAADVAGLAHAGHDHAAGAGVEQGDGVAERAVEGGGQEAQAFAFRFEDGTAYGGIGLAREG